MKLLAIQAPEWPHFVEVITRIAINSWNCFASAQLLIAFTIIFDTCYSWQCIIKMAEYSWTFISRYRVVRRQKTTTRWRNKSVIYIVRSPTHPTSVWPCSTRCLASAPTSWTSATRGPLRRQRRRPYLPTPNLTSRSPTCPQRPRQHHRQEKRHLVRPHGNALP